MPLKWKSLGVGVGRWPLRVQWEAEAGGEDCELAAARPARSDVNRRAMLRSCQGTG